MLQSSGKFQTSLEDKMLKQGVFSYYLLKGLKGEADRNNDGIVVLKELIFYLEREVQEHCKRLFHMQKPELDGNFDPDMPLSIISN